MQFAVSISLGYILIVDEKIDKDQEPPEHPSIPGRLCAYFLKKKKMQGFVATIEIKVSIAAE